MICVVKTWCESTREGMRYLSYNGYEPLFRILWTKFFVVRKIGNKLRDVKVLFEGVRRDG